MGFWDDKKPPKEDFASKKDIKKLEQQLEKLTKQQEIKAGTAGKLVKGMAKGFGDIGRSLANPESKQRPRISQMPGGKAPIASYNTTNPISGRSAGIKRHHISNAPKRKD